MKKSIYISLLAIFLFVVLPISSFYGFLAWVDYHPRYLEERFDKQYQGLRNTEEYERKKQEYILKSYEPTPRPKEVPHDAFWFMNGADEGFFAKVAVIDEEQLIFSVETYYPDGAFDQKAEAVLIVNEGFDIQDIQLDEVLNPNPIDIYGGHINLLYSNRFILEFIREIN